MAMLHELLDRGIRAIRRATWIDRNAHLVLNGDSYVVKGKEGHVTFSAHEVLSRDWMEYIEVKKEKKKIKLYRETIKNSSGIYQTPWKSYQESTGLDAFTIIKTEEKEIEVEE